MKNMMVALSLMCVYMKQMTKLKNYCVPFCYISHLVLFVEPWNVCYVRFVSMSVIFCICLRHIIVFDYLLVFIGLQS